MTDEEQREAFEAVRASERLQTAMLAERGGVPFPSSTELIREMRQEPPTELKEEDSRHE